MDETLTLQEQKRSWPPERGWPLFLAWMAGVVVSAILSVIIQSALMQTTGSRMASFSWLSRLMYLVPSLLGRSWEAWLLLRRYPVRFVVWAALPLVMLLFPQNYRIYQYALLVYPLLEAALLNGVRQRVWLWILVGMAGVVISSAGMGVFGMRGYSEIQSVAKSIGGGSVPTWLAGLIMSGVLRGLWMLKEALAAWALAWKMPVVERDASRS